jgi:hypothetical protein
MRSPEVVAISLLLGSCSTAPAPPPAAPAEVAIPEVAPSAPAPADEPEPASAPSAAEVTPRPWVAGRPVVARGRPSDTPWQHMMGHVEGKQAGYFDLADGGQTVVYVAAPIECPGLVEVEGQVLEVRGSSKRPGEPESKVDDSYVEQHVDVRAHRCL